MVQQQQHSIEIPRLVRQGVLRGSLARWTIDNSKKSKATVLQAAVPSINDAAQVHR